MADLKKCSRCERVLILDNFHKNKRCKDGRHAMCKSCRQVDSEQYYQDNKETIAKYHKRHYQDNKEYYTEQMEQYRRDNKDVLAENARQYYQNNKGAITERRKQYLQDNKKVIAERKKQYSRKNKEAIAAYQKKYRQDNKEFLGEQQKQYQRDNKKVLAEQRKQYHKERYSSDPLYRLAMNLRKRLNDALNNKTKSAPTMELLGCTPEFLRDYLEAQFVEGMTWDNYNYYGWHVDHVLPCSSFDLSDPEQQKKCFHYTNLQPLWAKENRKKSDKILVQKSI